MLNTDRRKDLEWVRQIAAPHPRMRLFNCTGCGYARIYDMLPDDSTVWIKIDDDIVFIQAGAIECLAWSKLHRPDVPFMGGNVINHAQLAWVHQQLHAVCRLRGSNVPPFQYGCYSWTQGSYATLQHDAFLAHHAANPNLVRHIATLWFCRACNVTTCGTAPPPAALQANRTILLYTSVEAAELHS